MDSILLEFLAAPMAAALVIAGIHAYLGLHVVERGVIFVDLSLAQIASLGATIAIAVPALGGDPHSPAVYWMSLAFTLVGALVFAMVKGHEANIPQEAIIGISYAVASAAVIVVMSKAPERLSISATCSWATSCPYSGPRSGRRPRCTRSSAHSTTCSANGFWKSRWIP
jgi:ABC-type Mn2+/Zn2+ transport system permease subunit